ncbi:TPA: hypothetical protein L2Y74_001144 [Escherichia coli]|nr:hypothetical protein [Escherichia coli]
MFEQYYLNEDGEKVYFHEELGMRFEWMKPEDIKRVSKGLTAKDHVDDIEAKLKNKDIDNITIIGLSVKSSREFGKNGNSNNNLLIMYNGVLYDNYKITGLKTKLEKITNNKFKPSFTYTDENYYYYVTKLGSLEERGCYIYENEHLDNGIMSYIKFTYSDGFTQPRRINDIITKTSMNVRYFITPEMRETIANTRCNELGYTLKEVYKKSNGRYYVKYICDKGHECNQDYYAFTSKQAQKCGCCSQLETHSFGHNDCKEFLRGIFVTEREKTFPDLKNKSKLPYDFYIRDINTLFEYDGSNHFEERESGWGNGLMRKKHDKIKTEYAIKNGYNFIRIAYYEDHIGALKSFLKLIEENPGKQIVQIYGEVQII